MSDLNEKQDEATEVIEPLVGADYQTYRAKRDAEKRGTEPPAGDDPDGDDPEVDENDQLAAGETGAEGNEPPAEEEPEGEPPAEGDDPPAEIQATEEKPKGKRLPWRLRKKEIEREIDDTTRRRHDAKRQADDEEARKARVAAEVVELETRRAALLAGTAPPPVTSTAPAAPPVAATPVTAKPADEAALRVAVEKELGAYPTDPDKFEDYEQFTDAKFAWNRRLDALARDAAVAAEVDTRLARVAQQEQAKVRARDEAKRITTWLDRVETFKSTHADYDDVIKAGENLPLHMAVKNRVVQADGGPAVLYHLCSHPTEATELAALPVEEQLERLGVLRNRLAGARNGASVSPPGPPISRARPPIKTVRGTRTTSTVLPGEKPYQLYKADRDKARRAARGVR